MVDLNIKVRELAVPESCRGATLAAPESSRGATLAAPESCRGATIVSTVRAKML